MADDKAKQPPKPQPKPQPQVEVEKRDKGGRVTSDQAPPQRPKQG